MRRTRIGLRAATSLCAFLLALTAAQANGRARLAGKTSNAPAAYFPIQPGRFWSYVSPERRDAGWVSVRVLARQASKTAECYQLEFSGETIAGPRSETHSVCLAVTPNALSLIEDRRMTYQPPLPILKSPLRAGTKWKWEGEEKWTAAPGRVQVSRARYEFVLVSEEPVEVPAGRFRAWRLRIRKSFPNNAQPAAGDSALAAEYWFVKDIGVVKATGSDLWLGIHGELKEFASRASSTPARLP